MLIFNPYGRRQASRSFQSKQLTSRGANVYPDWFDPAFALPVSPKPQLVTMTWAEVKTTN